MPALRHWLGPPPLPETGVSAGRTGAHEGYECCREAPHESKSPLAEGSASCDPCQANIGTTRSVDRCGWHWVGFAKPLVSPVTAPVFSKLWLVECRSPASGLLSLTLHGSMWVLLGQQGKHTTCCEAPTRTRSRRVPRSPYMQQKRKSPGHAEVLFLAAPCSTCRVLHPCFGQAHRREHDARFLTKGIE